LSRIRIVPTLVITFTALIVLFGGWIMYRNYGLVRPLERELSSMAPVQHVNVVVNNQTKEIQVTLKKVPDLMTAYQSVKERVTSTLGNNVKIVIRDHRSKELIDLYQNYQPLIFEGIAKGNYTSMIDTLKRRAANDGITNARITMDKNNIYIQLEKGSDYLYEIVPYHEPKQIQINDGQGGDQQ
jgi:hypothetical protein